jgi:hypothetical protein
MLLLRVEAGPKRRAFYWIYNTQDSIKFNQFVGLKLKAEAHEILLTPRCRMFYDIDLKLDEIQKNELAESMDMALSTDNEIEIMDSIGKRLAGVFKEATLISLEEHGIDIETELVGFDWLFTMRNRPVSNDGFKISIHLVTNLVLPFSACSAIARHVKSDAIRYNTEVLGVTEDMVELLSDAIDETQYRRHGSLSLPFGTKTCGTGDSTNWIYQDYAIPGQYFFITMEDQFSITQLDLAGYNIANTAEFSGMEASPEFVQEALKHVNRIKDYDPRVWDINASTLRKSTMYVKRYAPSYCSVCCRVHDNDNTLFLIFNSEKGIASWKCTRLPSMRAIVFYNAAPNEDQSVDDELVEAFASKRRAPPIPPAYSDYDDYIHHDNDFDLESFATVRTSLQATSTLEIEDPLIGEVNPSNEAMIFSDQDVDVWIDAFVQHATTLPRLTGPEPIDPFDIAPRKQNRQQFEFRGPIVQHPVLETVAHASGDEMSDDSEPEVKQDAVPIRSRGIRRTSSRYSSLK